MFRLKKNFLEELDKSCVYRLEYLKHLSTNDDSENLVLW
jgi:hypothetical protein